MTAIVKNKSVTSGHSRVSAETRAAIIKRYRELLLRQRDSFRTYLTVLDKQQAIIGSGSAEDLLAYVEMEEHIIADIFAIQKVINPLESMYRSSGASDTADDIPVIKSALEYLKIQTAEQSGYNRDLIKTRMEGIRTAIRTLKNNPVSRASLFRTENTASLIDISG